MRKVIADVVRHWNLIQFKAHCDLKEDSSRAYLGVMWWYLEPLLYLSVFYLIRGVIFEHRADDLVGVLLCGIVFWRWFDSSVRRAANSVIANSRIATQAYLPKIVFPLIALNAMARRFLIILAFLLLFLVFYSGLTLSWFYLPGILLIQCLVILGIGVFLSAVVPFLPDLTIIINNGLTLLFFASGVFFDISVMEQTTQTLLYLNPMAVLITAYRDVLVFGGEPGTGGLLYCTLFGLVLLIVGCELHRRYDMLYPKLLTSM